MHPCGVPHHAMCLRDDSSPVDKWKRVLAPLAGVLNLLSPRTRGLRCAPTPGYSLATLTGCDCLRAPFFCGLLFLFLLAVCLPVRAAEVLINEIMYHPTSEDVREEYV